MGDTQYLCDPNSVYCYQGERRESGEWEREREGQGGRRREVGGEMGEEEKRQEEEGGEGRINFSLLV